MIPTDTASVITADLRRHAARPLARRAASFGPSPWEAVIRLLDRHPNMIFFGNGAPAAELMPVARLQEAAAVVWADASRHLGYGDVAGFAPLRDLVATRMAAQGIEAAPDSLLLTNGSQQGIDLIARLLLDPGDVVVVEAPTYLGALQVFDAFEATYLTVPTDADGLRIDALEQALAESPRRPKLLYTVPTFQNPTGSTMPPARREALLSVSRAHGILVVEDDPYGELRYDGPAEPALRALDPEVVYLGTFSKTIAPGLRVGWLAAPPDLVTPLLTAREAGDIHNERITARIVHHAASGFLDDHLVGARAVYRGRRDAMLAGLADHLPSGARWTEPQGGFFVWVELPGGLSADALLPHAAGHGVVYLPGSWFYPDSSERGSLRLSFSTLSEEAITEGTRRLGRAVVAGLAERGQVAHARPAPSPRPASRAAAVLRS
ncbi:MAG: PLP-dependent aminotransferase family protein [Chloroflexota bacterium]|nr:PLP-dependent aminotransferase family protein [Chloroflexota bacterium]